MLKFGSPRVSMVDTAEPAAAAISTAALRPIVAEDVGTKETPTAGVIPNGRPTARKFVKDCAGVAVPRDTMVAGVPAVVAVSGVPDTGDTMLLKPEKERL